MAPAEGKTDLVPLGQHLVSGIAVYLQDAAEAGEVGNWLRGLAVRRVDIGHPGRIAAAPRSIVPGIGKELAGFGSAAARVEHRRGGLIDLPPEECTPGYADF